MSWIHPFWAFALPIMASLPLGWSMFRSLDPAPDRVGKRLDAVPMFLCRLLGRRRRPAWTGSNTPSLSWPSTPHCSS